MSKIILLVLFGFSFLLGIAQQKTKFNAKHKVSNTKSIDSCILFQKLLLKSWKLNANKSMYIDSLMLLNNETFRNCLLGKTRDEVIKLLGYPVNENIRHLQYSHKLEYMVYYTDPNKLGDGHFNDHYGFSIEIELGKNNRVKCFGNISGIGTSVNQ